MRSGFHRASVLCAALAAAFLLFAFIAPGRYLSRMTGSVQDGAELAREAVMAGDLEGAVEPVERINGEFDRCKDVVKLFFHHGELDELEQALHTALDLVKLEQSDNLICELNRIIGISEHMAAVESWDLANIL